MSVRRDIQGLRAFAVLAVILDHLLAWPGGGFVGVDVFFVISGFLITGLLVRESERTGRISMGAFYRRRVRRILPAAVLVLVVTVVAARLTWPGPRGEGITTDGVWALLFAANWRFASESTDYFAAAAPPSPLQHYWSLSVEEQFYFVWPLVLIAVFALVVGRSGTRGHGRAGAGIAIGLLSLASFAWALHESRYAAETAYFSTFSRAWELGVGAGLAVAAPLVGRLPGRLRPPLAWAGLAGMVASLWLVSEHSTFPAPAALLPVLSTAAVIAAGTGVEQQQLAPLTNRVAGYVGDLSYSLYLWHFPVIVIGRYRLGDDAVTEVVLLIATLVVAHYSFHLVEEPVRRSGWLTGGRAQDHPVLTRTHARQVATFGAVAAVAVAGLSMRPAEPARPVDLPVTRAQVRADLSRLPPETRRLRAAIVKALDTTAWPGVRPAIPELADVPQTTREVARCGWTHEVTPEECTFGDPDGPHAAVVLGDSIAMTYAGVLRSAFAGDSGWRVTSFGTFGCPYAEADTWTSKGIEEECPERRDEAIEWINANEPDVVFVSMSAEHHERADGTAFTPAEWRAAVAAYLDRIDVPSRMVFVTQPPLQEPVAGCYTLRSVPADCAGDLSELWTDELASNRLLMRQVGGTLVDSRDWFCAYGRCPAFVGGITTMSDGVHMTPQYADRIAPAFLETMRAAGVLSRRS